MSERPIEHQFSAEDEKKMERALKILIKAVPSKSTDINLILLPILTIGMCTVTGMNKMAYHLKNAGVTDIEVRGDMGDELAKRWIKAIGYKRPPTKDS